MTCSVNQYVSAIFVILAMEAMRHGTLPVCTIVHSARKVPRCPHTITNGRAREYPQGHPSSSKMMIVATKHMLEQNLVASEREERR